MGLTATESAEESEAGPVLTIGSDETPPPVEQILKRRVRGHKRKQPIFSYEES